MRGRTKLISLAAILTIMLTVSMVFASGILDVSKLSFQPTAGGLDELTAGTANLFVNPKNTVDSTKQPPSSTFQVHINTSGTGYDLFTWQINLTYNKNIINVNKLIYLTRATLDTSSEVLGLVINVTDNVMGYSAFSETILGNVAGVSGVYRLATVEFIVKGHGSTNIIISQVGPLKTTLLDSFGVEITPTITNGYFRNKYPGDVNGDKTVGSSDFIALQGCYGTSPPNPVYNKECDFNVDDYVGSSDFITLQGNYGKTFP